MTRDTSVSDYLTIAWAVRVDPMQLAAHLSAYVDTKASITTFRLAARYISSPSFQKLPEEILSQIVTEVQAANEQLQRREWTRVFKCLSEKCSTLSHIEASGMMNKFILCCMSNFEDQDLQEWFSSEAQSHHHNYVKGWITDLEDLDGSSKIAKCVQVFYQDFSIRPYFMLDQSADDANFVKAYVTLPLRRIPIHTHSKWRSISFTVKDDIDRNWLMGLTPEEYKTFRTAVVALDLDNYQGDRRKSKQGEGQESKEGGLNFETLGASDDEKNVDPGSSGDVQASALFDDEQDRSIQESEFSDSDDEGLELLVLGCGRLVN